MFSLIILAVNAKMDKYFILFLCICLNAVTDYSDMGTLSVEPVGKHDKEWGDKI